MPGASVSGARRRFCTTNVIEGKIFLQTESGLKVSWCAVNMAASGKIDIDVCTLFFARVVRKSRRIVRH